MSQINFVRNLIGETLSLEAQIRLWNFRRPNLIFTMSIDSNHG